MSNGTRLLDTAREHLATVITGLIFMWVGIRVAFVSQFTRETALAIIEASGPLGIGLGVLTDSIPFFAAGLLGGLVVWRQTLVDIGEDPSVTHSLLLIGVLLGGFFIPLRLWPGLVGLFVLLYGLGKWDRKRGKVRHTSDSWVPGVVALALIFGLTFNWSMWLPPESLSLNDGGRIVGYVLESEGEWTSVLVDEPRIVERPRTNSIVERRVCRLSATGSWGTIASLLSGNESSVAECPKS